MEEQVKQVLLEMLKEGQFKAIEDKLQAEHDYLTAHNVELFKKTLESTYEKNGADGFSVKPLILNCTDTEVLKVILLKLMERGENNGKSEHLHNI